MPETILIALIYSKIKYYTIGSLFKDKMLYCILIMEAIYIYLQIALFKGNYEVIQYAGIFKSIYLCTYLGLILKYELYKEALIGSGTMLIGGICNQVAIVANQGKMPVFPSLSYLTNYVKPQSFEMAYVMANDIHVLGGSHTKLKYLTDFIDIGYSILSIGDVLIRVFVFLIIYGAVKKINEKQQLTDIVGVERNVN